MATAVPALWRGRKVVREVQYRGYTIRFDPPPIPIRSHDWQWSHTDWDLGDKRAGASPSLAQAKRDIDEMEEDIANGY